MKTVREDNRLIASLAVFRELYNSEKDVYGIIAIFLTDVIKNNNLYSFNVTEITGKLNTTFDFEIPHAVVIAALNRLDFLQKTGSSYSVSDVSKIKQVGIDEKQQTIVTNNETIIDNLYKFIESQQGLSLSTIQKEKIGHSFICFLMDLNNGDEYIEYITAFILENEQNTPFKEQLNLIREGVILYNGIKYNSNLNDLGTWRTELTIYIETEILFHLAGYNGELYQSIAENFLKYVHEINRKSAPKKLIKLKYFTEVKTEIEGFFTKAKYLVEGNRKPDPTTTAMVSIVNGCKSIGDVLAKKSDFYVFLTGNGIEEDNYSDYFADFNHKYNIVSQELIDKVSEDLGRDTEEHIYFLNYISIHRKEASANNFENIGAVLLTGNTTTIKVAWNDLLKDKGNVPLATHLSFLINKFWFKLNKGFGQNNLPKTFDIITKSQIILSKALKDSVSEKFAELKEEYKSGKLTEEQAKARIVDLRNQVRKPEEIKNDVIKDVLNTITEDSLEKFVQEQSHFKIKAENQQEENLKLLDELQSKKGVEGALLNTKQDLLTEKMNRKSMLESQKAPLDKIAEVKYRNFKYLVAGIIILYYAALIAAIFIFKWDVMEPYTYILGALPILFSLLFSLLKERNLTPMNYVEKQRAIFLTHTYRKFNFDIDQLDALDSAIEKIKSEIEQLKKQVN